MYPQYSPECGPHYCCAEHKRPNATFALTLCLTWQANIDIGAACVTHLEVPIWRARPLEVARAFLNATRVHDFLHLSTLTFGKWSTVLETRIGPPTPRLVAQDSDLVREYTERSPQATALDVMRYLCDEKRICNRDHPASRIMDNIPVVTDAFTVDRLLNPDARLAEWIKADDLVLFVMGADNEHAICFDDATRQMWAYTDALHNYDSRRTIIHIVHNQVADVTYDEVVEEEHAPPPHPPRQYGQKAPMTTTTTTMKRQGMKRPRSEASNPPKPCNAYTEVNEWCREQGAPRGRRGKAETTSYKPSTRYYGCMRMVHNFNFIVQVRGSARARACIFAEFTDVPKIYYGAMRAERTLLLVTCATHDEREARIANHARAIQQDAEMPRNTGIHLKQLLREWFSKPTAEEDEEDDEEEEEDEEEDVEEPSEKKIRIVNTSPPPAMDMPVIERPLETGVIEQPLQTGVIEQPLQTGVIEQPLQTGVIEPPLQTPAVELTEDDSLNFELMF
jgi:hypothetical protein